MIKVCTGFCFQQMGITEEWEYEFESILVHKPFPNKRASPFQIKWIRKSSYDERNETLDVITAGLMGINRH